MRPELGGAAAETLADELTRPIPLPVWTPFRRDSTSNAVFTAMDGCLAQSAPALQAQRTDRPLYFQR